jgi:chromosomal replication initiation ATPase DnaA
MNNHLNYVAAAFNVHPDAVLGHSRNANVAAARQLLYWLLRQDGMSYPVIGALVGRHHTTVIHGVRAVNDGIKEQQKWLKKSPARGLLQRKRAA